MVTTRETIDRFEHSNQNPDLWQISHNAMAEAAGTISSLTQCETRISVQSLGMIALDEAVRLFDAKQPEMIAVSQRLEGQIKGHAIFVLKADSSMAWLRQLLNEKARLRELTQMEEEALAELGNIVLNSCLASYIDLLEGPVVGGLPQLNRGHYTQLLQGYVQEIQDDELFYVLVDIASGDVRCQACMLWTGLSWQPPR